MPQSHISKLDHDILKCPIQNTMISLRKIAETTKLQKQPGQKYRRDLLKYKI